MTSLKYFCEEAGEYAIIAAGSLVGVADHVGTGVLVGKVDRLDLYPMSFPEFLEATDNEQLAELLHKRDLPLINHFADMYTRWLRTYFYVGGMPEAVDAYVASSDFEEVRRVQLNLLSGYRGDFSKHAPTESLPKLNMVWEFSVWDSVPRVIGQVKKKMQRLRLIFCVLPVVELCLSR